MARVRRLVTPRVTLATNTLSARCSSCSVSLTWGALWGDPETDPAHHHDQHRGDVGGEEEVAGVPLQFEDSGETGECSCGVVHCAVLSAESLDLQLGQPGASEETLGGSERGDRGTYLISGLTIRGSILEAIKIKRGIGGNLAAVGELSLGQPGQDRRSGQSDL